MRVLLTGATGFIGRRLQTHLLQRGVAVRALVRPASAATARLDPGCEVRLGELTDPHAVRAALGGVDVVVYCAGSVRGAGAADFEAANVAGVQTLVSVLEAGPAAPRVVLLSSLAASRPELSHYARSKHRGEEVLRSASDLDWTILRPPAVYGPGDREMRPLLDLVRRGLALRPGPAGQRLALLHVDDLVRAVAACIHHPDGCRHRTFAIDDGRSGGYDWRDIAAAVAGRPVPEVGVPGWLLKALAAINLTAARVAGYAPMLTPGKVRELQQVSWLCDNRAFIHATGWQPEIDLKRGAAALFRPHPPRGAPT